MVTMVIDGVEEVAPPVDEEQRTAEQRVVDQISAGDAVVLVRLRDGSEVRVSPEDLRGLRALLVARARGQHVSIVAHELLISPQKAASLLGVSRPTVYRYIESGELGATRVGSHWRLRAGEVLAFAGRRAVQAMTIDAGFAAALDSAGGSGRLIDAKQAWHEATDEERRQAEAMVADLSSHEHPSD
jgi:excisionase family DNA binding protein